MDVRTTIGDDRTLRRIIALLLALAVLAERVGARSLPLRCFVFWLLRRAETVAGEFVLDMTGLPPAFGGIAAVGNGPTEALRLARRFRALAAALAALLPMANRPAPSGDAFGHIAPGLLPVTPAGPAPRSNDTS